MYRVSGDFQGRANNFSQVEGVSDMSSTCHLCGSVDRGFRKGTMAFLSGRKLSPSSCLDARHFSSSPYATGAFQVATPVLELRGTASE